MNALFLKDLADKTRRGLRGRVEAGKSGGGAQLRLWRRHAQFERRRGRRASARSFHEEAAIVRRIFTEYAAGASPKQIARTLNREGVPAHGRRLWSPSTIHGHGSAAPAS